MFNPIKGKLEAIQVIRDACRKLTVRVDETDCHIVHLSPGIGLKETKDVVEQIMALAVRQFLEDSRQFISSNEFYDVVTTETQRGHSDFFGDS